VSLGVTRGDGVDLLHPSVMALDYVIVIFWLLTRKFFRSSMLRA
jgi:hypothetical protein